MIINNLNIVSVVILPFKTNPPLIVDTDAVLSGALADKFFKPVCGWNSQIVYCSSVIQHSQLPKRGLLNISRQFTRANKIEYFFSLGVLKRLNHMKSIIVFQTALARL